jgi:hypothetical protein
MLRASKSKAELERIRLHIRNEGKIEEFKKESNRSGDALLESIKNQTK